MTCSAVVFIVGDRSVAFAYAKLFKDALNVGNESTLSSESRPTGINRALNILESHPDIVSYFSSVISFNSNNSSTTSEPKASGTNINSNDDVPVTVRIASLTSQQWKALLTARKHIDDIIVKFLYMKS
jgi:hypothetical protein